MSAPDIDFAPSGRPGLRLAAAALALAILACAWGGWRYTALKRDIAEAEAKVEAAASAARRERDKAASLPPPRIEPARLVAVNGAIARLNVPWPELLSAFEADAGGDVALLGLLPDAKRRVVLVQAEARNTRAMVDFAERLRTAPRFRSAFLVKHERREQDAGQPYRFTVEVHWEEAR